LGWDGQKANNLIKELGYVFWGRGRSFTRIAGQSLKMEIKYRHKTYASDDDTL